MKHNNPVIAETLKLTVGELICLGLMWAVYGLIGRFSMAVFAGGIVGTILTIGNFFLMAVSLFSMTGEDVKARFRAQGSYLFRTLALLVLLVVAIKYGGCDPLATVIPLLTMRVVIMVEQFMINSGQKEERESVQSENAETAKSEEG